MTYDDLLDQIAQNCFAAMHRQLGDFTRAELHMVRVSQYAMPTTMTYAQDNDQPRHDQLVADAAFLTDLHEQVNDLHNAAVAESKGEFTSVLVRLIPPNFEIEFGYNPVDMREVVMDMAKPRHGWERLERGAVRAGTS